MQKAISRVALLSLVLALSLGLSSCHTLRGIGKDASLAGHAIKNTCKRIL